MSEATRTLVDPETGETVEVESDDVVQKRPFVDTLRMLELGKFLAECTDEQHAIVTAVEEAGTTGELVIRLKYKPDGPQVAVVGSVTAKIPKASRGTTLFYPDRGNLSREHPRQRSLDIAPAQ